MATYVHLTQETNLPRIKRSGIATARFAKTTVPSRGLFAMPVTLDFYATHQWLRELKRTPGASMAAVYFRLDDKETVYVGRYAKDHPAMTAAEAVALLAAGDQPGLEVIVPRRVLPGEVVRIKALPQTIGWRYYPEAKGNEPLWFSRGEFGGAKFREKQKTERAADEARYYSRFPAEWYSDAD